MGGSRNFEARGKLHERRTKSEGNAITNIEGSTSVKTKGNESMNACGSGSKDFRISNTNTKTVGNKSTNKFGSRRTQSAGNTSMTTLGSRSLKPIESRSSKLGKESAKTHGNKNAKTVGRESDKNLGPTSASTSGSRRSTSTAGGRRSTSIAGREKTTWEDGVAGVNGNRGIKIRVGIAFLSLLCTTFDIITAWLAFWTFIRFDGGPLTLIFAMLTCVASSLVILEVKNCWSACKVYWDRLLVYWSRDEEPLQRLDRWQETSSFLIMLLRDIPVSLILFTAFVAGKCELFLVLFDDSGVDWAKEWAVPLSAYYVMLGTIINSLWKLILSLRYCFCACSNFHDVKGCGSRSCCCIARIARPIFAGILILSTVGLYLIFLGKHKRRPECYDTGTPSNTTTMVP